MRALVIADLHISDVYNGQHKDYLANCKDCLNMITDEIKSKNITHLLLLGDLVGQNEKNLKNRSTLLYLMQLLNDWNSLTKSNYIKELESELNSGKITREDYAIKLGEVGIGNVYSVKGNHDMGNKLTDFELLEGIGLIKVPDMLDIGSVRYHFVHYGEEYRHLNIDEDKYNIALVHNNIMIDGITTWYRGGKGIEMSTLENMYGVALIIAGHIHDPSLRMVTGNIKDSEVALFYPGNITRPRYEKGLWETAFGVYFEIKDDDMNLSQVVFNLKPVEELFNKTFEDVLIDDIVETPVLDVEELSAILNELQTYSFIGNVDYKSQLVRLAGLDKEASDLAIRYIEEAENK